MLKNPKKITTEELLSIIVGDGNDESNLSEISKIIDFMRSKKNNTVNAEELIKFKGISENKALKILSSIELGRRFYKDKITKKLSSEDWDFMNLKQSERQYGVHFFHHYTAKFIPQIPAKLIQKLSKGNDIIVDPFMGSGTTLVEAKLLGCHSYGFDTNPLAIKIAKAKTMTIDENKIRELDNFLEWIDNKRKTKRKHNLNNEEVTLFPDSNLWFRNDVAYKIKQIMNELKKYSNEIQNLIDVGLSDLLKGMSNARMDYVVPVLPKEYIYIDKKHYYRKVDNLTRNIPVYSRLYSQLKRMKLAILKFNKETDENLICKPILGDARELSEFIKRCDLVITSPPYWSAQNYEKLHMLSFKLFNLQINKEKEIGRKSSTYLIDMKNVFFQIKKILNGYFAIVIGEDNKRRQNEKLFEFAKEIGFKPYDVILRRISNQTSRSKQIKNEFIYIFKN